MSSKKILRTLFAVMVIASLIALLGIFINHSVIITVALAGLVLVIIISVLYSFFV